MLKRLLIIALLFASGPAFGQAQTLAMARAVTACGGQSLTNGNTYPVTQDLTGKLCNSATGSTVSSNITQFGGTNISTGTGTGGLGIPRVTVSSDSFPATYAVTQSTSPWVVSGAVSVTQTTSPWVVSGAVTATLNAETTKVIGTVNQGTSPWVISGSLTANQSVNVAQVNGVTTLTGTGAVGTGAQRIAIGTDTATIAGSAPGTAGTASANVITTQEPAPDPCHTITPTYTPISMTSATTLRVVAPTSAKRTYICYMFMISAIANNVAVVEGTGGTCGSSTAGVVGGTTAANGLNLAANSGAVFQAGGNAAVATAGTNVDLCLITSAAGPLAGHIKWVQAP